MAKELPYFKFEPGEWENGNIQCCSHKARALFIELCCLYWTRLGEVPYALALHKLFNGNNDAFHELEMYDIFTVENEQIKIQFLDEQLNEFQDTSEKRRNAANKRWKDAKAMQVHSKSNAIREDKIREDKKKKEDIIPSFDDFLSYAKSKEPLISQKHLKYKYDAWKENGWKDLNDKKITNWKSKLNNNLQYIDKIKPNSGFTNASPVL